MLTMGKTKKEDRIKARVTKCHSCYTVTRGHPITSDNLGDRYRPLTRLLPNIVYS